MYQSIKKYGDPWLAALLLLVLSPITVIVAILVTIDMKGACIFKQERLGQKHQKFMLYKFKTMRDDKKNLEKDRITLIGNILRKTSLDEIPQLFNILKGEMSFIGPRPLLPEYLSFYSEEEKRRHDVKPGITGWAQVNGRNSLDWEEKFQLDLFYVDYCSLQLDSIIIFKTLKCLVVHQDVNQSETISMKRLDEVKHGYK